MKVNKFVGWTEVIIGVLIFVGIYIAWNYGIPSLFGSFTSISSSQELSLETSLLLAMSKSNVMLFALSIYITSMIIGGLFGLLFILEGIFKIKLK